MICPPGDTQQRLEVLLIVMTGGCWGTSGAFQVVLWQRICLPMQEAWVRSLVWEDSLEKEMETAPVFLPWSPMDRGQRSLADLQSMRSHSQTRPTDWARTPMGIEWGGTRDAAKHPTTHRLIQPKMSIVPRLRNPDLVHFIKTVNQRAIKWLLRGSGVRNHLTSKVWDSDRL